MSDEWWVMSDKWRKLNDGNWVIKKKQTKQGLSFFFFFFYMGHGLLPPGLASWASNSWFLGGGPELKTKGGLSL